MSINNLNEPKELQLIRKQETALVSVIIPTYNRANLVCNAIESALNQTFKNIEIIVIDDGSTDNTREKLEPYKEYIRYHYQNNMGASAAQNKGIELARGEWISILASDDIWLPEKIELQLEAIRMFGDEFGACFTDCKFVGTNLVDDTAFKRAGLESQLFFDKLDKPHDYILGHNLALFVQSMLVKRYLVTGNHGFNPKLVVLEDTDLIFRLSLKTKFCFVNKPLVIIDRTPILIKNRLSGLIESRSDAAFQSMETMYFHWLANEDLSNRQTMIIRIKDCLKLCYYDWIIVKIKKFKWGHVLSLIKKIKCTGEPYGQFLINLLKRAFYKLLREMKLLD